MSLPSYTFAYLSCEYICKKNLFMQKVETRDLKVGAGRIKSNFLRILMHILPMVIHRLHSDKPQETLGGQGR